MGKNFGLSNAGPKTPDEVIAQARANCLKRIRKSGAQLRAHRVLDAATESVVGTLRGKRYARSGNDVLFHFEDCVAALRIADRNVALLLAA